MSSAATRPAITQATLPLQHFTALSQRPGTSLAAHQSPDTINDLAYYILAQIAKANSLEGLENRQVPALNNPGALTPTPILLGGQTCVLCTLVGDLVLGVSTFVFGSLRGIWQLTGVPFVNLAVTLLSPFIMLARVIMNTSAILTGIIARAFQPLYGNGDPNQFVGTYWGLTNALSYALLFWPARLLVQGEFFSLSFLDSFTTLGPRTDAVLVEI